MVHEFLNRTLLTPMLTKSMRYCPHQRALSLLSIPHYSNNECKTWSLDMFEHLIDSQCLTDPLCTCLQILTTGNALQLPLFSALDTSQAPQHAWVEVAFLNLHGILHSPILLLHFICSNPQLDQQIDPLIKPQKRSFLPFVPSLLGIKLKTWCNSEAYHQNGLSLVGQRAHILTSGDGVRSSPQIQHTLLALFPFTLLRSHETIHPISRQSCLGTPLDSKTSHCFGISEKRMRHISERGSVTLLPSSASYSSTNVSL